MPPPEHEGVTWLEVVVNIVTGDGHCQLAAVVRRAQRVAARYLKRFIPSYRRGVRRHLRSPLPVVYPLTTLVSPHELSRPETGTLSSTNPRQPELLPPGMPLRHRNRRDRPARRRRSGCPPARRSAGQRRSWPGLVLIDGASLPPGRSKAPSIMECLEATRPVGRGRPAPAPAGDEQGRHDHEHDLHQEGGGSERVRRWLPAWLAWRHRRSKMSGRYWD